MPPTTGTVMIVAGEASGDMHGAALVQAMRQLRPELHFCGMGGRELQAAGVELLYDAAKLAVVGAVEVLSHLGDILQARRALLRRMRAQAPKLLILIDYPDFNLLLASQAKKLGIPILYYISPQIWAWRKKRVHTIGRLADCVAVILPFEEQLYRDHGYRAVFVGHPLLDRVHPTLSRSQFMQKHQLAADNQLIGLLPGSRKKEIQALLPIFLATAATLCSQDPQQQRTFLIPQASTISRSLLEEHGLAAYQGRIDCRVISEDRYSMMAACDACLAASGTVTLELALLRVPSVVAYRVAAHTYWLGKLIIRSLPFFSLPNLIASREIVPELLQHNVTPQQLLLKLKQLLVEGPVRNTMQEGFSELRLLLGETGAAKRTAALALEILGEHDGR
ncbi:MAG: lipid-A-disaccharide synthase [Desulfobulbus sp.]